MRIVVNYHVLRQGFSIGVFASVIVAVIVLSSASTACAQNAVLKKIDPANVIGNNDCKMCHGSELKAIQLSKHHKSLDLLNPANARAKKYAEAMGVDDMLKDSICARCHATPAGAPGAVKAAMSVSCESCHGPAKNWIVAHKTLKGMPGIRAMVRKKNNAAGMIRPDHIYEIAKNCFQCHIVPIEKLVEAGHPATTKYDLELVGGSSGEVRHNFQLNQMKNELAPSLWMKLTGGTADDRRRVKYVVGMLVDLEVTLLNLGNVKVGNKTFAKENKKRYFNATAKLEAIMDKLGGDAPQALKDAATAIEIMGKQKKFGAWKGQAKAQIAQPMIAKAAKAAGELNGKGLAALDDLLKNGNKKPKAKKVAKRGEPYDP